MSESVTLQVPDSLAQRARALAAATNRRLEEVLLDWLDQAAADPDPSTLSDVDLLRLCDLSLDPDRQEELSDLLARVREGNLSESDRTRLDELMLVYRRGLVLKARAWSVAVARGLKPRLGDDAA